MRALTMDELSFVSGGFPTDGNDQPVPDNTPGWDNYRNPITGENRNPLKKFKTFESFGKQVDAFINNPATEIGKVLDSAYKDAETRFHNQMVEIVNRDRNNDGKTTDGERSANWEDWQKQLAKLNGN